MIALALLLAAQAASAPVPQEDVIVTGRRMEQLKRLRITTKHDRAGVPRCVFRRRSGDPALDAAICEAVLACIPKVRTPDEMHGCLAPIMDALAARRPGGTEP